MSELRISVVGIGYVGLVTAVTFSELGFKTVCTDVVKEKVEGLRDGRVLIYEPGLEELVRKNVLRGRLTATTELKDAVESTDVTFICVGTPFIDKAIDLSGIRNSAENIGRLLKEKNRFHTVVIKSTVPPSTTDSVVLPILESFSGKRAGESFGLCMNPEFLREGNAVQDSMNPDRIVIGEYDGRSGDVLDEVYKNFQCPKLRTDLRTAEMIKYASNVLLATKITFANEIANICERFSIDVYEVMKGVGLDSRINPQFLNAGCGFGGSCFPKDVKGLIAHSEREGYEPKLLRTIMEMNESQALRVVDILESAIGRLDGKSIALLGLSFKPDTDDVRETRALPIAKVLMQKNAKVIAYDPKAMDNFKELISNVEYAESARDALNNVDACIIQSDWEEFRQLKIEDFKRMRSPVVIDGRRTFEPNKLIEGGIVYKGIGWKN